MNNNFSEFISNSNGEFKMRLGYTVYVKDGSDIYWINKAGVKVLVSEETHITKPWIRKNFDREIRYLKRKTLAEVLSKPCFHRTPYSANQRIAYNNEKYNS